MASTRCPVCGLIQPRRNRCADADCNSRLYNAADLRYLKALFINSEQDDIEDTRQADERRFRPIQQRMQDWQEPED